MEHGEIALLKLRYSSGLRQYIVTPLGSAGMRSYARMSASSHKQRSTSKMERIYHNLQLNSTHYCMYLRRRIDCKGTYQVCLTKHSPDYMSNPFGSTARSEPVMKPRSTDKAHAPPGAVHRPARSIVLEPLSSSDQH